MTASTFPRSTHMSIFNSPSELHQSDQVAVAQLISVRADRRWSTLISQRLSLSTASSWSLALKKLFQPLRRQIVSSVRTIIKRKDLPAGLGSSPDYVSLVSATLLRLRPTEARESFSVADQLQVPVMKAMASMPRADASSRMRRLAREVRAIALRVAREEYPSSRTREKQALLQGGPVNLIWTNSPCPGCDLS